MSIVEDGRIQADLKYPFMGIRMYVLCLSLACLAGRYFGILSTFIRWQTGTDLNSDTRMITVKLCYHYENSHLRYFTFSLLFESKGCRTSIRFNGDLHWNKTTLN